MFDKFFSHRRPSKRSTRRAHRARSTNRLQFEALERRELMSASPFKSPLDRLTAPVSSAAVVTGQAIAGSAATPTVSTGWFATVRTDSIIATTGQAIQGTFAGDQYTGVRNQWIVQLTDAALQKTKTVTDADKLLAKGKLKVICGLGMPGWVVVNADGTGKTAAAQEKVLRSNANIAFFEPNKVVQGTGVRDVVNDPRVGEQYGLDKIDVAGAWAVSKGSRAVTAAVIDTGGSPTHPDLAANTWRNPGEIAGNRRDDDGNGFVDDVYGWDFYANDNDPKDENGHGTHVSGIIGAVGNNGQGIVGVNQEVSIMAVRGLGPDGSGSFAGLARTIDYVTLMKSRGVNVPVINASWGSSSFSQPLYAAIKAAGNQQILFVAAAGNDGRNADLWPKYPAGFDLPNIVSVAATDDRDTLASFSNYGATSVDIAAPGVGILSTVPGNQYASMSGTSMAAPHVAGVAALAVAKAGSLPVDKLRSLLLSSADVLPQLSGKVATGGRLNAARALSALLPGITISDVTAREGTGSNSVFRFTVSVLQASPVSVSVEYATADGTARAGDSDYVSKSGRLEWAANDTTPRTIDVLVVGDAKYETNENFSVLLRNATNARIADGTGLGAIENDDPTPSIRIADARIVEGDAGQKAMLLTITLSNPSSLSCTVYTETANGSSIAGQDYVAIPPQTGFWFLPGETQKELTVNVIGDTVFEGDEFFYVRLSSPANCTMADGEAVGTIVDDDPQVARVSLSWKFPAGGRVYLNVSSHWEDKDADEIGVPNIANIRNAIVDNNGATQLQLSPGEKYRVTLVADNTAGHPGRWAATKVITGAEGLSIPFSERDLQPYHDLVSASWAFPTGGAVYLNVSSDWANADPLGIPRIADIANARVDNSGAGQWNLWRGSTYRVTLVADDTAGRPGRWAATKVVTVGEDLNIWFSQYDLRR